MKCRACNRFSGFEHLVQPKSINQPQQRMTSYVCPRCGHRKVIRQERRVRSIPVRVERRAAAI